MGLQVASIVDPRDNTSTLTDVFAYMHKLTVLETLDTYVVEVWIQKNAAAAALQPPPDPIRRLTLQPGSVLVPAVPAAPTANPPVAGSPAVVMPSLDTFWTQADAVRVANPTLSARDVMKKAIYDLVKQHHEIVPNTEL